MKKIYTLLLFIFISINISLAANRYWVSAASSNWNNTANWSASSGGAPGVSVPVAGDFVFFNANGAGDCDFDIAVNIDGINTTNYLGIIDLNGFAFNPTVGGSADCTFKKGTFNDTPGTQTLNFTTTGIIYFSGATFNIPINVIGGRIAFNGGIFNSAVIIEDNGPANHNGQGGCTFNSTFKAINTGTSYFLMGSVNPDIFNGTVTLLNSSTGHIRLAYNSIGTQFNDDLIIGNTGAGIRFGEILGATNTLAAGKTIIIDGMGFDSGELRFGGFTQLSATPQSFSLTGTTTLIFRTNSVFNGAVDFDSPKIRLDGVTFNSTSDIEKTGVGNDYSSGGNIFVGDCIIHNSGTGTFALGNTNSDDFQANLLLNNTASHNLVLGHNSVGNTIGGNLSIVNNSSGVFGHIYLCSSNTSDLTITGTTTSNNISTATNGNIYLGTGGDVTFNNNVTLNNAVTGTNGITYMANNSTSMVTVNGNLNVTNSLGGTTKRVYLGNQGDITVNGVLSINNASSATNSDIYCNTSATSQGIYNGNIILESTNAASDGVIFGGGGGLATLAATKTITIGGAGYISGALEFRYFTQISATPQTLIPNGTTIMSIYNSTWDGDIDFRSPNFYTNGTTYNGTAHLEKTGGNSGDYSSGGNLFVGDANIVNSGSEVLYLGGTSPDICQADLNLSNTGSDALYYAANSAANTVGGNLVASNTGSGTTTRISIAGSNISSIDISGDVSVINNPTSTTSYLFLGDGGDISVVGDLTASNSGLGNDYIFLGRSGSLTVDGVASISNSGSTSQRLSVSESTSSNSIFNSSVTINNSGTGSFSEVNLGTNGDVVVNGVLTINNSSSATNSDVDCNRNVNSVALYNENIIVENTNILGGGVKFGDGGGSATLAATKTITIGAGGFVAGHLLFRNFTQTGPTDHSLLGTGTSRIYNRDSDWGGNVDFRAPRMYTEGTIYNQTSHLEKTGAVGNDYCSGGNMFVGNTILKNSGSNYFLMSGSLPDSCQANLDIINTGTSTLYFAYNSAGNNIAGNTSIQNSGLGVYFSHTAISSASIAGTFTTTNTSNILNNYIYGGLSGDITIGGNLNISNSCTNSGLTSFARSSNSQVIINGNSVVSNTGTGAASRIYLGDDGDITFNGTLAISNSSSSTNSHIYCNNSTNSSGNYNENITVESTHANSDGVYFGNGNGVGVLAATKTITINAGGFIAGHLLFRNFTQIGPTDQSLLATGTTRLYIRDSDWGGNVDFRSPRMYTRETTYNQTSHIEKTGGIGNDWSEGGNLFIGNTVIKNSGSSYIATGGTLADVCQANLDLINTGSHTIYYANNSAGNTIAGNLFMSNTGTGSNSSIIFSSGASATATVSGNIDVVNNATSTGSSCYIGNSGTVNVTGNVTALNQGTGSDYIYIGSNNTVNIDGDLTATNSGSNNNYIFVSNSASAAVTIGGSSIINNTSAGNLNRIYLGNSGDITFNGTLALNNSSSSTHSQIFCNNSTTSTGLYNQNITVENTNVSGDGVYFGSGTGNGTLANGKTISISAGGFIAGQLFFRNFTQLGNTPQTLQPTGTTRFENYDSQWNGNVDFRSPGHFLRGTTFNGTSFLEKNGINSDASIGGNIFNGDATMQVTNSGYFMPSNNTSNDFNANATYIQTSTGRIYPGYNCVNTYAGNVTANSNNTTIRFGTAGNGRTVLDGTVAQSINNTGTTTLPEFRDLQTINPNSDITVNAPIVILIELDLDQGNLITTATNLIFMNDNSIVSSVTDNAFVDGPLEKIGNDAFTFPIGKVGFYRPAGISAPSSGSARFRGEFFAADVVTDGIPDLPVQAGIHHVSDCEYWIIDRITTANNVNVTLSYKNYSANNCSGVLVPSDLVVARWDGSIWENHGNGGVTGGATSGTVVTSAAVTSFSPFTLADLNGNNPLPIELVEFTATNNQEEVDLFWETASETNNDFFTVERSSDGVNFNILLTKQGAGNSVNTLNYYDKDIKPLSGVSYYRLKQTDFNGDFSYSGIIKITRKMNTSVNDITIYPNPVNDFVNIQTSEENYTVNIFSVDGRLIKTIKNGKLIDMTNLASGIYQFVIMTSSDTQLKVIKVIKS